MKRHLSHKTLNLIICLSSLFLLLGIFVSLVPYPQFDIQITRIVQSIPGVWFSQIMYLVSLVGFSPYIIFIVVSSFLLLCFLKLRLEALLSLFLVFSSAILGSFIKVIAGRPRPDGNLVQVITELSDKSFPSNHALIYTAFFGFLFYLSVYTLKNKALRFFISITSAFLVVTIGISRIYLGAHWASDVLGGYLLGTILLASTIKFYRIIGSHAKR
jgi:membrane-associated phospholipid phosphatase